LSLEKKEKKKKKKRPPVGERKRGFSSSSHFFFAVSRKKKKKKRGGRKRRNEGRDGGPLLHLPLPAVFAASFCFEEREREKGEKEKREGAEGGVEEGGPGLSTSLAYLFSLGGKGKKRKKKRGKKGERTRFQKTAVHAHFLIRWLSVEDFAALPRKKKKKKKGGRKKKEGEREGPNTANRAVLPKMPMTPRFVSRIRKRKRKGERGETEMGERPEPGMGDIRDHEPFTIREVDLCSGKKKEGRKKGERSQMKRSRTAPSSVSTPRRVAVVGKKEKKRRRGKVGGPSHPPIPEKKEKKEKGRGGDARCSVRGGRRAVEGRALVSSFPPRKRKKKEKKRIKEIGKRCTGSETGPRPPCDLFFFHPHLYGRKGKKRRRREGELVGRGPSLH